VSITIIKPLHRAFWTGASVWRQPQSYPPALRPCRSRPGSRRAFFGREILQDDLGEALVLALPALQPLISFFGYGDRLGGHRSMYVYLLVYLFFCELLVFDLLRCQCDGQKKISSDHSYLEKNISVPWIVPRGRGVRGAATARSGPRHPSASHRAGPGRSGGIIFTYG